ncbi:MAG: FG-GAP-like repeat-containing protein, partial [candidate division Zixibacteria bacterium]|nr:FG-GAP-like repeat-containing protein [candidate division Zixibacteria bacterium]
MKTFKYILLFLVSFPITGYGQIHFEKHLIYEPTVENPESVFSVDIDGDGDMDIVVASSNDDKISWFANRGDGVF